MGWDKPLRVPSLLSFEGPCPKKKVVSFAKKGKKKTGWEYAILYKWLGSIFLKRTMSIREINALICSPSPSSGSSRRPSLARTSNKQGLHIESWKRFFLLGSSCHRLPEGTCNFIHSSTKDPDPIRACSRRSADSADGAPFSSQQSWWLPWHTLYRRSLHHLESFGIGAADLAQGTIGLLLVTGTLGLGARFLWQKGSQIASMPQTYEAVLEFPFASGITIGTVVRVRGVDVGSVINVRPCLERIDARIQVTESTVYIPRNALVEVNQSGLVGETLIDITPMTPVPCPSVGPLDPGCSSEGLIVCHKERIKGQQGVSMDDLMRICGKMARNTKDTDLKDLFKTADQIGAVVDSSKPLLEKVETFVEDVEPVLKELQDGKLLKDLTELLQLATHTTNSLRMSSFTTENKRALVDSVANVATTVKDLEITSEDVCNTLKNEKNRKKLKHLVELLSRLVDG
eukprot:c23465_g1_i1 orf=12-1385(+)